MTTTETVTETAVVEPKLSATETDFVANLSNLPGYNGAIFGAAVTESVRLYHEAYQAAREASSVNISVLADEAWKNSGDDSYAKWVTDNEALAKVKAQIAAKEETIKAAKAAATKTYHDALAAKSGGAKEAAATLRKVAKGTEGILTMAFGGTVPDDVVIPTSVGSIAGPKGDGPRRLRFSAITVDGTPVGQVGANPTLSDLVKGTDIPAAFGDMPLADHILETLGVDPLVSGTTYTITLGSHAVVLTAR